MAFVTLSGTLSVNPDNFATARLDGRTIVLTTESGHVTALPFPDATTAAAAYTKVMAQFSGGPFLTVAFPSQGGAGGGLVFVLTGGGFFVESCSVKINAVDCSAEAVDPRTIRATTPANPVGVYNIVYTRSDGATATLVNGFEYV